MNQSDHVTLIVIFDKTSKFFFLIFIEKKLTRRALLAFVMFSKSSETSFVN